MSEAPRTQEPTFQDVVAERISRRSALKAAFVLGAGAAGAPLLAGGVAEAAVGQDLKFTSIPDNFADATTVAAGYTQQVVIRWGDPVLPGAPAFDLMNQTAAAQATQFGVDCDYLAFWPLPQGSRNSARGLLWNNHEVNEPKTQYPVVDFTSLEQARTSLAAHGCSIIEVERSADGTWRTNSGSAMNRRITGETPITITGPAAGPKLATIDDPTGTRVLGMLNNCGGGTTPWRTNITCEENFNQYFANNGTNPDAYAKAANLAYGFSNSGDTRHNFHKTISRFDCTKVPREGLRFGWAVEVDPYDPTSTPKKRTALGRFAHEAAEGILAPGGRYAMYMGDDARFEYIYKFVTKGTVDLVNKAANDTLLDSGVLYVAKFAADGTGTWIPLVATDPRIAALGFDQADVCIRTRDAADAVGATPMDRPEDIDIDRLNNHVFIALTNNTSRTATGTTGVDAPNPRANNRAGHVIELVEAGDDPLATSFRWEIFILCGEPSDPSTFFGGFDKTQVSRIGAPDNLAIDNQGNLWIASDGMPSALSTAAGPGPNDSLYGTPTKGPQRGHLKRLFSGPLGCEIASMVFTPDDTTVFVNVQHPGENGTIDAPQSQWPMANRADNLPPRQFFARGSTVAISRIDRTPIGYDAAPIPAVPEFKAPLAIVTAGALVAGAIALRNRRSQPADNQA